MNEATKTVYIPIPRSCTDTVAASLVSSALNALDAWVKCQPGAQDDGFLKDAIDALKTAMELRKS